MNEQVQQSVSNAINRDVNSAATFSIGSGLATILEIAPQLLGCVSMIIGIVVTVYFAIRKKRLYDEYDREREERKRLSNEPE